MAGNKIALNVKGHYDEGILDEAASPGMAIQLAADGHYDQQVAAVAAAIKSELIVLIEDSLQGKTATQAYAIGDLGRFVIPLPGDRVQLLIKDGEDIAVGDDIVVEGGGSGLFVEAAGTEARFQARALEAVAPVGANALCACRIC